MWVTDNADDKIYAYNLATKTRDSSKDFDTLDAANNNVPDLDSGQTGPQCGWPTPPTHKIYAYNLSTKARNSAQDFDTLDAADNDSPNGIWSNGTTMWVGDFVDQKVYAYQMSNKARDADKDIPTTGVRPSGITSNGTIMWVADQGDGELYAFNMSTKARDSTQDFTTLAGATNESPYGIWTDGNTMWVADSDDDKLYSYNGAISSDATLSALTVSPKDIIGFDPERAPTTRSASPARSAGPPSPPPPTTRCRALRWSPRTRTPGPTDTRSISPADATTCPSGSLPRTAQ